MYLCVCWCVSGLGWETAVASGVCLCGWKKLCVPKGGTVHACSAMQFSPGTLCCPFPSWSLSILWLLFLSIMLEGAIPPLLSIGCSPAITNTSSLGLCPPLKACQALDKPPLHVGSLGKQDRNSTCGSSGFNLCARNGEIVFPFAFKSDSCLFPI